MFDPMGVQVCRTAPNPGLAMMRWSVVIGLATMLSGALGCLENAGFTQPPSRDSVVERPYTPDGDPNTILPPSDDNHMSIPGRTAEPEPEPTAEPEPEPVVAPSACTSLDLVPVPLESLRLTDVQFENAVRALFSYPVTLTPEMNSTAIVAETFTTFPGVNEVLRGHAEDMIELSEALAVHALDNMDELLVCDPAVDGEGPCAEAFIDAFGVRAFRRPVRAGERADLMTLFDGVRTDANEALTFEESIATVVQAILLSPQLLYLVETGTLVSGSADIVELTSYELASRLSFLFWNEPPDAELQALAADGSLTDPDVLQAQATRLLDDERARVATVGFFEEWFGVAGTYFDDRVSPELATAFNEEFARNMEHMLTTGGTLQDLLSYDHTHVNASLADHYNIAPNPSTGDDDWQYVELPSERGAGLLSSAVFAAATAHGSNRTSFIHRGKAVRERLLCGQLGTPDASLLEQDPVLPENATVRAKMDARMQMSPCGDCHILMDPIGIGMEDIDEQGLFRAAYDNGNAMDVDGEVLFVSGLDPAFHGVNGLAEKLAESDVLATCAVDQWFRYVVGRRDFEHLDCLVERLQDEQMLLGDDLRGMLLATVTSDAFRYRRLPPP